MSMSAGFDSNMPEFREISVQLVATSDLRPNPRNPRTHSAKQIRLIAASIREFGFACPILIDEQNLILAGHGRVAAASLLGIKVVPCVLVNHLTETQKRAFAIADNKLALMSGWDEEILSIEFRELTAIDPSFDISLTGFDSAEIDLLIDGPNPEDSADSRDDVVPSTLTNGQPISRLGDLWLLGPHRVLCGDATDPDAFVRLLGDERGQASFVDPPYNVPIEGHVSGLGQARHREFPMASGEMSPSQFIDFLKAAFSNLARFSIDGSIHYACMDWRHLDEMLQASKGVFTELKNLCVWVKDNGGMGTFYRSRHELVFVFKSGSAPHLNTFELGQHGRYRTNVWPYKGVNSFGRDRQTALEMHPTTKPVQLVADAIKDVTQRNGVVIDCFGGSGSTLIACQKTGRRARLMELDPAYVDTILRRYEAFAHDDAILSDTGKTFSEIRAERSLQDVDCSPSDGKTHLGRSK